MNNLLVSVQVLVAALCLTSGLKSHTPFMFNKVVNLREVAEFTNYFVEEGLTHLYFPFQFN